MSFFMDFATVYAGSSTFITLTISSLGVGVAHSDAVGNITSSLIVNADVDAAAAIAGTKISPSFGSQTIITTGNLTAGGETVAVGTAWAKTQTARTTDAATNNFTTTAQAAWASAAGANLNGGNIILQGGARGSTSGLRGGLLVGLNGTTDYQLQVGDAQPSATAASRYVALCRGQAMTATELPTGSGDGVVFVGNAAAAPTVLGVNGATLYAEGAVLKTLHPLTVAGITTTAGTVRATTAVNTGTYQALTTDYDIPTDSTASSFTVTLLASPETGREFCIHDAVGLCGTPYRVTISGGAKNINGFGTSMVMASPFFSVTLRYNGTIWNIV